MNLSSYLSNRKYARTVEHLSRVLIKKFKLTMIVVIAYIINFFAPIILLPGIIGLLACTVVNQDFHILLYAGVLWVVGLIFGIFAYRNDVPPRWSWSKSTNELFDFAVTAVLGYAWNFAMWPCAIYFIYDLFFK